MIITAVVLVAWSYGENQGDAPPPKQEQRPCPSNLMGGYKCIHQENHDGNHQDARGREWI
jgi:hypothetical protein